MLDHRFLINNNIIIFKYIIDDLYDKYIKNKNNYIKIVNIQYMINEKDRIKYYLNDLINEKNIKLTDPINVKEIIKNKKNSNPYEKYWKPLIEKLIKYNYNEKLFICKPGDITKNLDNYYSVKIEQLIQIIYISIMKLKKKQ